MLCIIIVLANISWHKLEKKNMKNYIINGLEKKGHKLDKSKIYHFDKKTNMITIITIPKEM